MPEGLEAAANAAPTPDSIPESNSEINQPESGNVGSGEVAAEVAAESGLTQPLTTEQGQAMDEASEIINEAIDNGATEEQVQDMIKKFSLKVFGKEIEKEIDLSDEDAIRQELQWAAAARESMQKAKEYEKSAQALYERARENPWEFMEEIGYNPDELAESRIEQMLQQYQKSPEELAQEQKDAELEELRNRLKEEERIREEVQLKSLQAQYQQDFNREIQEALSATSQLPKNPAIVRRVATAMLDVYNQGYTDVTPKDVIPWVEKQFKEELNSLFEAMPTDVLDKYVSKNITEKLRKGRISKNTAVTNKTVETKTPETKPEPQKKRNVREWMRS